jgi:membrane protein YqaA with SNARE-associated domain
VDFLSSDAGLWALFFSAFVSATLLPGGSEALLAALAWQGAHDALVLLVVASIGNTLGGMSSWGLGWLVAWRYPAERLVDGRRERAVGQVRRWGSPALLFSWLPVVGDPLCFAAGWLRVHWVPALVFIGLGKAARYAAILWVMPSAA